MGAQIDLALADDLNVGVLYILAVASISVYGIVLAGWSSNNKYAMLGGLRSSAQMISYELALGLSFVGPIMLAGSMSMGDIVEAQAGWLVCAVPADRFRDLSDRHRWPRSTARRSTCRKPSRS